MSGTEQDNNALLTLLRFASLVAHLRNPLRSSLRSLYSPRSSQFQYLHPASHSSLVTLGDVITGKKTIERGKGVKIVDLTGAGAQDAAIAGKVMEKWDNKVE